jgi:hypothetical protein
MSGEETGNEVTPTSHTHTPDEPVSHESASNVDEPVCDLCGATMDERHCKLVCRQCGYMRDCSDP